MKHHALHLQRFAHHKSCTLTLLIALSATAVLSQVFLVIICSEGLVHQVLYRAR